MNAEIADESPYFHMSDFHGGVLHLAQQPLHVFLFTYSWLFDDRDSAHYTPPNDRING